MMKVKRLFKLAFMVGAVILCFNSSPIKAEIITEWEPEAGGTVIVDGLTATIVTASGYQVADVLIDGVSMGAIARCTLPYETEAVIYAYFVESPIQVTPLETGQQEIFAKVLYHMLGTGELQETGSPEFGKTGHPAA